MSFEYPVSSARRGPGQQPRRARAIAFYLPQFHPVPENDTWWGEGFTEWTNVRKARPLFAGHMQPRIPGLLGYYDLRDPAIREAQALLASGAGIEAFCYWHYWFGDGRRILDLPFRQVLASGQPDFPFCLCWANESWTGIWHGAPDRLLIEQTYPGPTDYAAHFETLLPAFRDRRYVKIAGKPIFLVYRPDKLPDPVHFTIQWRRLAAASGLPGLHLVAMGTDLTAPCMIPFDAVMPYGPRDFLEQAVKPRWVLRAGRRLFNGARAQDFAERVAALPWLPARYDYTELAGGAFVSLPRTKNYIPCILAGWDNTPRSGRRGIVLENFSAAALRRCMRAAIEHIAAKPSAHRLIFVKSWNEWAEGNYLEPDQHHGTALLEALRAELLQPAL